VGRNDENTTLQKSWVVGSNT